MIQARPILTASLGLNLALVAALLYQVSTLPSPELLRSRPLAVTNKVTELDVEIIRAPAPEPVPPFKWSDVESADYKTYIANLKGIGCPPATISDIVLADVRDDFVRRRTVLLAPIHEQYWELLAASRGKDAFESQALDKLEADTETLLGQLSALIGPIPEPPPVTPFDRRLDFLPEDKRPAVAGLEARYRTTIRDLNAQLLKAPAQREEITAALQNVKVQRDAEIEQLLTPAEWEEFQLRSSPNAAWASQLFGFEPTPAEFRSVTRLKDAIEVPPAPTGNDPAARAAAEAELAAYRTELSAQLQKLFGAARYAELERAMDPDFVTLYKLATRYELPAATAIQAYQVRLASENQYQSVMQQDMLSDDEKIEAVITIHLEATKALQKALGDEPYKTYLKHDGNWLEKMIEP
jgi:hypothetical protein